MAFGAKFPLEVVITGIDRITTPIKKTQEKVAKALEPIRRLNNSLAGLKEAAGLDGVATAMGGVGHSIGRVAGAAKDLVVRVGGIAAAAVGAATALVLGFAHAGAEILRLSRKLGIGVEALQEWRYAARLAEVEDGALEKGLAFLSRNLGQAAIGTGTARVAFRRLGIEVKDANGRVRSMEELLPEIADKLGDVDGEARKAALAAQIFGRGGLNLLPFLREGSEGLREAALEAKRLGVIMSEEDVEAGHEFTRSWTKLQAVILSVRNAIAKALLPVIGDLIREQREWFIAHRADIARWARLIAKEIPPVLRQVRDTLRQVGEKLEPVIRLVGRLADRFGSANLVIAGTLAVLGAPLLLAVGSLGVSLANLAVVVSTTLIPALVSGIGALGGFEAALLTVLGPIALVAAAIGALAYLGVVIYQNWDALASFFKDLWDQIYFGFIDAWNGIASDLPPFLKGAELIVRAWGAVARFFEDLWAGIRGNFDQGVAWVADKIAKLTSILPDWLVNSDRGAGPVLAAGASRAGAALAPNPAAAPGAAGQGLAAVRVDFANAPAGTRAKPVRNDGVDLDLSMGYAYGGGP